MECKINVRRLRLKAGMTQADFADALGLKSASTVSMWESGTRTPSGSMIPKIANVFGCSVDSLYTSLSPSPAPEPEPEPEPKPADPRQSPGFIGNIPPAERLRIALEDLRSTPRAQPVQDGEP